MAKRVCSGTPEIKTVASTPVRSLASTVAPEICLFCKNLASSIKNLVSVIQSTEEKPVVDYLDRRHLGRRV